MHHNTYVHAYLFVVFFLLVIKQCVVVAMNIIVAYPSSTSPYRRHHQPTNEPSSMFFFLSKSILSFVFFFSFSFCENIHAIKIITRSLCAFCLLICVAVQISRIISASHQSNTIIRWL